MEAKVSHSISMAQWQSYSADGGSMDDRPNPFLSRMQQDVVKRESQKQLNELKKTAEGRKFLKTIDPSLVNGSNGAKKPASSSSEVVAGIGLTGVTAPKVVVHSQNKINDNKQWNSETWSKNSYLF
mmetsp:Transcript_59559/g.124446  ORF Transcript_59559/g.124446 Transcript_59559/m.124446 type:complete len:126 (-) Transcript_59559:127-504(-)